MNFGVLFVTSCCLNTWTCMLEWKIYKLMLNLVDSNLFEFRFFHFFTKFLWQRLNLYGQCCIHLVCLFILTCLMQICEFQHVYNCIWVKACKNLLFWYYSLCLGPVQSESTCLSAVYKIFDIDNVRESLLSYCTRTNMTCFLHILCGRLGSCDLHLLDLCDLLKPLSVDMLKGLGYIHELIKNLCVLFYFFMLFCYYLNS